MTTSGGRQPNNNWRTPEVSDRRKCPKHNSWMKKGKCEPCLMERDRQVKEIMAQSGRINQEIKIIKL